jgi:hypothetical protein
MSIAYLFHFLACEDMCGPVVSLAFVCKAGEMGVLHSSLSTECSEDRRNPFR